MRRLFPAALFILLALTLVLILSAYLPRYSEMFILFFVFLLAEGYLWLSVRRGIAHIRRSLRVSAHIFFWLPALLLVAMTAVNTAVPFLAWPTAARTYLLSSVLIVFLSGIFPMAALVMADLFRLSRYALHRLRGDRHSHPLLVQRFRPLLAAGWIAGGALFLLLIAGSVFWQFAFRVREVRIRVEGLPAAFDGFRIVQISDVHLGSWGVKRQLERAVDEINALHPDALFFTGDMFNYGTSDGDGFLPLLKPLKAPEGIFAILGNHDYGDYVTWRSQAEKEQNMVSLEGFYRELGWKLLRNEHTWLRRGSDSILLVGVENWGASKRFQRRGDLDKAMAGTGNPGTVLLLSHDPSHWDRIVSKRYREIDITFSGHTHGGQFGIETAFLHWSPIAWVEKHWCGLYQNPAPGPAQYLYVNQGLGNIGYAGRIGVLPEITLITLVR